MPMETRDSATRLARAVRDRRLQLGLRQEDAASEAGVSVATWRKVESGKVESFTSRTLAMLDRGLQWEPGSARDVATGGEPRPESITVAGEGINLPAFFSEENQRLAALVLSDLSVESLLGRPPYDWRFAALRRLYASTEDDFWDWCEFELIERAGREGDRRDAVAKIAERVEQRLAEIEHSYELVDEDADDEKAFY